MRKAEYKDVKLCNITNAEGREGDIPDATARMWSSLFPSLHLMCFSLNGSRRWQRSIVSLREPGS